MPLKNTKQRVKERREAAEKLATAREARTDKEQLALLDSRPGESRKERARLTARMTEANPEPKPEPKPEPEAKPKKKRVRKKS